MASSHIQFTTSEAFWDHIDAVTSSAATQHVDALTFQGVSPQDLNGLIDERGTRGRGIRFRRFDTQEQILIVVIPGKPHERLHLNLYFEVRDEISLMGLRDAWNNDGATRFFRGQGHPGGDDADGDGDAGEPDSSGSPRQQRGEREAWPTLVMEASGSSTLADLRKDMRWWFSASGHQVKIVLLAKLDRPGREIILEKWVETTPPPRPGPVTRAAARANTPYPVRAQEITIHWTPGMAAAIPASHVVTGGDLQLEFNLLFLRPPGPMEGDFLITTSRLQVWASTVWEVVV
ncbi:hypothetical protein B0T24DRAFT_694387 [Lasiosphaeria ovina]|uniref:Uncharacterized protein n=1 Tax=Lasiosphaeria ovina TaxID=92902 RepID=A0AAE0KLT4_9PEZI|nr:hypothetical protein B0T24DRAFT_694387 [Lasiosphaeria ovina]